VPTARARGEAPDLLLLLLLVVVVVVFPPGTRQGLAANPARGCTTGRWERGQAREGTAVGRGDGVRQWGSAGTPGQGRGRGGAGGCTQRRDGLPKPAFSPQSGAGPAPRCLTARAELGEPRLGGSSLPRNPPPASTATLRPCLVAEIPHQFPHFL